ncbi:MAG TPA: DUF2203 domain-containing protein [Candidatus Binataceae bacterium]|nr:DUF2203 domain-containing protein [Candidatus Binataceae bacterium]
MPKYNFDKLFTPAEANELLPRLEILVRELQSDVRELRDQIRALADREPGLDDLGLAQIVERHPQLREPAERMAEAARKIETLGCFLKDIDQGLIDFPWEIDDDNVVFLCWQFGEPAVDAWHPVEGGFAERAALPGAPKRYLN